MEVEAEAKAKVWVEGEEVEAAGEELAANENLPPVQIRLIASTRHRSCLELRSVNAIVMLLGSPGSQVIAGY